MLLCLFCPTCRRSVDSFVVAICVSAHLSSYVGLFVGFTIILRAAHAICKCMRSPCSKLALPPKSCRHGLCGRNISSTPCEPLDMIVVLRFQCAELPFPKNPVEEASIVANFVN